MTLQSSGQISLADLRTEYTNLGSRASVKLSDFYYGSTHVKRNKCTDQARTDTSHPTYSIHFVGIPVLGSSQIKLTDFYNKVYYYARQQAVQVNGSNVQVNVTNIENESLKSNSNNTVFFDVETSGNCNGSTTSNYALTIPEGSRPNTTCYFTNDYIVYGRGGNGGRGDGNGGENGGPAFYVSSNLYLKNNNRILGGGGGGGGGSGKTVSYNECYCCNVTNAGVGGSGGGGGKGNGQGGPPGSNPGANFQFGGNSGSSGDANASGGGGSGGSACHGTGGGTVCSNSGGNGGGWGESGGSGQSGGGGGSGGTAITRRSAAYYVEITSGTTAGGTVTF